MYDEILEELSNRYKKSTLNKKELAVELSISVYTVNAYISSGRNIPNYIKIGNAKNARVVFPLVEVAKFLSKTVKIF